MLKKYCILIIFVFLIILSSCKNFSNDNLPFTETAFLLGTLIEITTYNKGDSLLNNKVFKRIEQIENKMSINLDNTEIMNLNNEAGQNSVKLSDDTLYVLSKGKYYSELSKGCFDITIGSLIKLWNINSETPTKPQQSLIDEKLKLVDYKKLQIDELNKSAKLLDKLMVVDLGAIAKGYAADEAKKILLDGGITSGLINIGGNIMTIGSKLDGTPWKIGVQNPFSDRGEYLGILNINDETVVTSGDYEKYFEQDGIRYHHIIDPKTGYPSNNELSAVSIVSKNSIDADSLSTACFVMGLNDGINLIDSIQQTEAIFITKDKKVYLTDGLNQSRFELTDNSFELIY